MILSFVMPYIAKISIYRIFKYTNKIIQIFAAIIQHMIKKNMIFALGFTSSKIVDIIYLKIYISLLISQPELFHLKFNCEFCQANTYRQIKSYL